MKHRVIFFIAPHVHALDLGGPLQVFYEAGDYGIPYEIVYVSSSPDQQLSSGLQLQKLQHFSEITISKDDIIFIPGFKIARYREQEYPDFYEWLRQANQQQATLCSVCTGVMAFAFAGLLDGKECTTHWKYVQRLQDEFPAIIVLENRLFVQSGNIYTSAGIVTGIDLSLHLMEQRHGAEFAYKLSRELVMYTRRNSEDAQESIYLQHRHHINHQVHELQDWIIRNLDKKITIEELAGRIYTSPRNLTRLFKATTGITVGHYVEKLKAEQAVTLLKQQQKLSAVAGMCGFKSVVQLRAIVKKHTGILPSELERLSG